MQYLLTSEEMKKCDENTMNHFGMLSAVLMERAAMGVAEEILAAEGNPRTTVLAVCGTGNNGGDGIAAARLLFLKGYRAEILFPGDRQKATPETKRQLAIAEKYQIPIHRELPERAYDVIVDALFGIGLTRAVEGSYAGLIERLNEREAYKVAVDICSGLSADDGNIMGTAFRADLTVTFGFAKIGHMLYPGAALSGRVAVKDIGIDQNSLLEIRPGTGRLEAEDLKMLPRREAYSNKGSYGKILILAGSEQMAGAAVFSARAAYASGAGLVRVVTPACNRQIIQTLVPEAVLAVYGEGDEPEEFIKEQLSWADALVFGPGIGKSERAERMLAAVLQCAQVPCVLDADGLNLAAAHTEWLSACQAPVIVTPHLGEMSRLCGLAVSEIQKNVIAVARSFAKEYNVITVLKDARTAVSLPEGFSFVNCSGNDGMATAGAGDVLTGVIAALLGQKVKPEWAAPLGVLLHGMAGDLAAARVGRPGLTASDLITGMKEVLKEGN